MAVLLIMMAWIMPGMMYNSVHAFHGQRLLNKLMSASRSEAVHQFAAEVERYRRQTGQYPATLSALTATNGFEHARTVSAVPGIQYAVTTTTDSVWQFNRALVAGIDMLHTTWSTFQTTNTCGTGGFGSATDWCGGTDLGEWYKSEDRTVFGRESAEARARLNQTLMKFVGKFNSAKSFPAGSLSPGGSATLTSLAGAGAVSAGSCSGQFNFAGIPLDCQDIFNYWGGAVVYNYIAPSRIAILAVTPFGYAAGGQQVVVAEMHF